MCEMIDKAVTPASRAAKKILAQLGLCSDDTDLGTICVIIDEEYRFYESQVVRSLKNKLVSMTKVVEALEEELDAIFDSPEGVESEIVIRCPSCKSPWDITMYNTCGNCGRKEARLQAKAEKRDF